MTRLVPMLGMVALVTQEPAASGRNEIDIVHHLANSHTLEIPSFRPPYYREVELPQFTPFRVGRLEIDLSPTRHVVFLVPGGRERSEEHTSELQSRLHLVCRLLLEKKKTH